MTNKEAIEVLKGIYPGGAYSPTEEQRLEAINMAISTLANMPEEPSSEDLEEESNKVASELFDEFFPQDGDLITQSDFRNGIKKVARHFANWQKEQMTEALRTEYEKGRADVIAERWKPSKEQMSALRHCCDGWQDNADGRLESLYNDLKKL